MNFNEELAVPTYQGEKTRPDFTWIINFYTVVAFNMIVLQLAHAQDIEFRLGVNTTAKYLNHSIGQLFLGERDQFLEYVGKGARMAGESLGVLAEHPEVLALLAVSWIGLVGKKYLRPTIPSS